MSQKTTYGILLKKTIMANDDGVLDFFTADFGHITCFVPKLARSKKKAGELDFFRLLELEIFQGRNSKRLTSVFTNSIFHGFEMSYSSTEIGFEWLTILKKILPEDKPELHFFNNIIKILGNYELTKTKDIDIKNNFLISFFWVKVFCFMGIFPRFDQIQNNVWIDLEVFHFFSTKETNSLFVDNSSRQVLEFLRRSNFDEFWEKRMNLPSNSVSIVEKILKEIKKIHL